MLRLQRQKDDFYKSLLRDEELDRIADRVLSRMSVTVDASEAIAALDDIQRRIDRLCGK